jgi:hypothetical protein
LEPLQLRSPRQTEVVATDKEGSMDDVEEIKKLKARYFRCLDTKDWDGYRAVFTDDVEVDLTAPGDEVRRGLEPFMDYVRNLTIVQSVHHGHMPEIELTSPTTATGVASSAS